MEPRSFTTCLSNCNRLSITVNALWSTMIEIPIATLLADASRLRDQVILITGMLYRALSLFLMLIRSIVGGASGFGRTAAVHAAKNGYVDRGPFGDKWTNSTKK